MSTEPAPAGAPKQKRLVPKRYFTEGTWPYGEPAEGAPEAVLYAAQLASFLHETATAGGRTLPKGLAEVAEKTGIPAGTLRHVVDGDRWPGIEIVARVELSYLTDVVGFSALLRRRRRAGGSPDGLR